MCKLCITNAKQEETLSSFVYLKLDVVPAFSNLRQLPFPAYLLRRARPGTTDLTLNPLVWLHQDYMRPYCLVQQGCPIVSPHVLCFGPAGPFQLSSI